MKTEKGYIEAIRLRQSYSKKLAILEEEKHRYMLLTKEAVEILREVKQRFHPRPSEISVFLESQKSFFERTAEKHGDKEALTALVLLIYYGFIAKESSESGSVEGVGFDSLYMEVLMSVLEDGRNVLQFHDEVFKEVDSLFDAYGSYAGIDNKEAIFLKSCDQGLRTKYLACRGPVQYASMYSDITPYPHSQAKTDYALKKYHLYSTGRSAE